MHRTLFAVLFAGLLLIKAEAFQAAKPNPVSPDPNGPRPIEALDSVFIEELTWMEVRDAIKAGKTTAVVATGGVEQNGPWLSTGKHNVVLRGVTEAIARKLGNALVAPIVAFVPEGDIEPPTLHMKYPGTISLREETYQALLTDICHSLKVNGFTDVVLIGDSGGNQSGMKAVAAALNARWAGKARVHFIPQFYDYGGLAKWIAAQGIRQADDGLHDDFVMSAQMAAVDPTTIRMKQRIAAGNFRINGIDLAPIEKTVEWGKKIIEYRADTTVKFIRAAIGKAG
jgi:creatinine amidohydrolase/Fe(II)-dependent formamide hydrolase-like protein